MKKVAAVIIRLLKSGSLWGLLASLSGAAAVVGQYHPKVGAAFAIIGTLAANFSTPFHQVWADIAGALDGDPNT